MADPPRKPDYFADAILWIALAVLSPLLLVLALGYLLTLGYQAAAFLLSPEVREGGRLVEKEIVGHGRDPIAAFQCGDRRRRFDGSLRQIAPAQWAGLPEPDAPRGLDGTLVRRGGRFVAFTPYDSLR